MPDFNLHTHTARCHHAIGTDEAYVQAAIKAGLKVLGFSDHCPFESLIDQRDRMNIEEKAGYLESIASLKQKYQDQIMILSGFEFEYFPSLRQELQQRRKETDYLIIGNHYLTPGGVDFCEAAEDESVLLYAQRIAMALKEGLADYVAHPEYFMLSRDHWSSACDEAARIICEAASRTQVPLEINLKGMQHGRLAYREGWRYAYPWARFWEIAGAYGCTAVYGMDAHAPEHFELMAKRIEEVQSFLDLSGVRVVEQWADLRLGKKER